MPRFSRFTRYGLLAFTRRPSRAEDIYRTIVSAQSEAFDMTVGTNAEAEAYASSMALAAAAAKVTEAGLQYVPDAAVAMLPKIERDYGVVPGLTDTIRERQRAVGSRKLVARGARRENVEAALRELLGDDFVCFRTLTTSEKTTWPSTPSSGPGVFSRDEIPQKLFRLTSSITTLGSDFSFTYERMGDDDGVRLDVGDVVCVDHETIGRTEKVTIASVSGLTASATFASAHNSGVSLSTGPVPIWTSTKRHVLVVVTDEAAADRETRRRINELMGRIMRAVTTWSIVKRSSATTIGPFTVGVSGIGLVPIGTLSIP